MEGTPNRQVNTGNRMRRCYAASGCCPATAASSCVVRHRGSARIIMDSGTDRPSSRRCQAGWSITWRYPARRYIWQDDRDTGKSGGTSRVTCYREAFGVSLAGLTGSN